MSTRKFGDKLEELELSHEEIDRITKCMKDEKFRDMLREYAEEISDPENRKRYEEEIAMLERDRGMDVKFINPKPGHVLKTSINGTQKCFINICTNENLGQPRSRPSMQGSARGMQWSIPHSVSQAREDVDKAGTKCMVYDVVFHPDTYYLLKKNARFKKMIHDTAIDAVERQFNVVLDKLNVRFPKMTFKGFPMSSVIRTPNTQAAPTDSKSSQSLEDVDVRLHPPYPPTVKENGSCSSGDMSSKNKQPQSSSSAKDEKKPKQLENGDGYTETESDHIKPEYNIMHRGYFDIQDYRMANEAVIDRRPKELVINIDLPLLSAANSVNLEIFERRLRLESVKPAKYKLDFELPYPVAENKGFAKFDKSRHRLTVTLEVLPAPPPPNLAPFSTPPLVSEVKETKGKKNEEKVTTEDKSHAKSPANQSTNSVSRKVGIEEAAVVAEFNEATESTVEAVLTESSSTTSTKTKQIKKEKTKVETVPCKQPSFVEEGRRHYQEGSNWRDDDDLQEDPARDKSDVPLTKNSAFLIDMVIKFEGLIRRCPQYAFLQDDHFVSFIIDVPHIFEESLWYAVYNNMLQFCCLSECLDDNMVNSVFQLWLEFDSDCKVDPQRSRVDVSGNNAIFCLRKTESNREWHTVQAGFDKESLDTRRFSTASNVSDLYTQVFNQANGVTASPIAICKVARQEKDLVVLEFESKDAATKKNGKSAPSSNIAKPGDDQSVENAGETKKDDVRKTSGDDNEKKVEVDPSEKQQKKLTFAEDVKKNSNQKEVNELSCQRDVDSDDEENTVDVVGKIGGRGPAQGAVTIEGQDSSKEIITDHVTKSAVKLSSDALLYELDDDI